MSSPAQKACAAGAALFATACLLALASCDRSIRPALSMEPELVIFSSHPDEIIATVTDEFRERSGLRVRVVADGTGALLKRISSGEKADVLWGGGAESLAANVDLFEPYLSPESAAILPSLREEGGRWTGFTVLPMVILVNAKLLAGTETPRSWRDIAEARYGGAVAFAHPGSSGSSYTILRTMLAAAGYPADSDGAWRLVESFVKAIDGSPLKESGMVYRGVASGEYLVGLSYENAGGDIRRFGSDVALVYPEDGSSAVPDGVALIRGAAHPAEARAFMDFVLGQDVARVMVYRFGRRSARLDIPEPDGLPPLSSLRLVDYDFGAAARERENTIARFESMLGVFNANRKAGQ